MRGKNVINNWDFTANTARNSHKRLVQKIVQCVHVYSEMFVKSVSARATVQVGGFCRNGFARSLATNA